MPKIEGVISTGLQFGGNMTRMGNPREIVIHHPVFWGPVEDIHRMHRNRWGTGIGYHFYVREDGRIYEGRPLGYMGAGVAGHNNYTLHVCFEGCFHPVNNIRYVTEMPKAQFDAGVYLCTQLLKRFPSITAIKGHYDYANTACPGKYFPMDVFRKLTREESVSIFVPETKNKNQKEDAIMSNRPTIRRGSRGEHVQFLQRSLIDLGYDLSRFGADGAFGAETEAAVRAFQRDQNITVDGIVGPQTWGALDRALRNVREKEAGYLVLHGKRYKVVE